MSTLQHEISGRNVLRTVGPAQHHSKVVEFIDEIARHANDAPTSVEIFSNDGRWYCRVRRGEEKTRPMGPYTKQQAERIQEVRRLLIAKRGTAGIMFE
ncbi:hypothetical protein EN925_31465 [Mesorhizobium sp. M7A.F.Ca.US.006.04.2.1]|uniref:hypothetical protein n=1 Tax=unclassified Mesorhizobium TaxID=325217 RepID=UPI000FCA6646|nr:MULTISPECIES: hypothetical protein [unclassified Mesorhizobium]RUX76904.1 hypothetical protein EN990_07700 [Mesorhizobium sp. M7A.F.Ca.US.005.03.1.1]RUY10187.1 hypothetical protein EN991_27890 [Mesorhizobium sp. M7A.F.Ca.US.005.03.2.1]RVA81916.1 hypothetical protein EN925_31465 [Mesorhizobium sp. M7A.F.Ca.US.006.04.2.1]